MRTGTLVVALALSACTSPAGRPAPAAPSPSATVATPRVTTPAATRSPLTYVSDLAPGARRTLVGAGGGLHLYDGAGRLVSSRRVPGGGWVSGVVRAADGTTYVLAGEHGSPRLYSYGTDGLTRLAEGGAYPDRFGAPGAYRYDGTDLVRVVPPNSAPRWPLPVLDQMRPGAKGTLGMGREGPGPGWPLAVVATRSGPVVAARLESRCAVTALAEGRQLVLDAPAPYQWAFCAAAVVDEDGMLAVLVRHAGAYGSGAEATGDEVLLVRVDPVTLKVARRIRLLSRLPQGLDGPGGLVALPGGLVAFVHDRGGAYVVDLRGARPVPHRVPADLGRTVAAAGPDAVWVWGHEDRREVARVTVSTGRVERAVLRPPSQPMGIVSVP